MDYETKAKEARREILALIHKAQTSHVASNLSVIDVATVLDCNLTKDDQIVWSKGWAAATIYYFLWKQGQITKEQLDSFPNYPFLGLAETTVPGVLVNGGSVGHGLPVAAGLAYGKKLKGEQGKVYCIMSDGELNEGSVWEAAMLAAHLKLNNLVAIVDKNGWQAMGKTEEVISLDPLKAFEGFGWEFYSINGHTYTEIEFALSGKTAGTPTVIVANTTKGKGVSFMEDHLLFHYKHIDDEDYKKAMEELK